MEKIDELINNFKNRLPSRFKISNKDKKLYTFFFNDEFKKWYIVWYNWNEIVLLLIGNSEWNYISFESIEKLSKNSVFFEIDRYINSNKEVVDKYLKKISELELLKIKYNNDLW